MHHCYQLPLLLLMGLWPKVPCSYFYKLLTSFPPLSSSYIRPLAWLQDASTYFIPYGSARILIYMSAPFPG